jgi:chemotaxis signal transduction protein
VQDTALAAQPTLDPTEPGEAVEAVPDAIVVRLGVARYAVAMADVAEVVPVPTVTRVPGMPSWLAGVVNWRGHVLPLLDLRPVLGEPSSPLPSSARVVVLTRDGIEAGLVVELITGLLTPSEEQPLPAPSTASSDAVDLVVGVVDAGGPVSLLDAGAVLELRRSLPTTRRAT